MESNHQWQTINIKPSKAFLPTMLFLPPNATKLAAHSKGLKATAWTASDEGKVPRASLGTEDTTPALPIIEVEMATGIASSFVKLRLVKSPSTGTNNYEFHSGMNSLSLR